MMMDIHGVPVCEVDFQTSMAVIVTWCWMALCHTCSHWQCLRTGCTGQTGITWLLREPIVSLVPIGPP